MSRNVPPPRPGGAPLVSKGGTVARERAAADDPAASASDAGSAGWQPADIGPEDLEVDPAELREFLAADLLDVGADPVFKERLRQKLWRIVQARTGLRASGDDEDEGQ